MLTILESIAQLKNFSEQDNVKSILNRLMLLELPDSADELIDELRKDLQEILKNSDNDAIKFHELSFSDAAYHALLALADFHPRNPEDPITLFTIEPADRIVLSTGYQFDINALALHFEAKKEFIDPLTNLIFSPRDQVTIRNAFAVANIKLKLSDQRDSVREDDVDDNNNPRMNAFRNRALTLLDSGVPREDIDAVYDNAQRAHLNFPEDVRAYYHAIDHGLSELAAQPAEQLCSTNRVRFFDERRRNGSFERDVNFTNIVTIPNLIKSGHLTEERASQLTDEEKFILGSDRTELLISGGYISVDRVLALTKEEHAHLTTADTYSEIVSGSNTIDNALAAHRNHVRR